MARILCVEDDADIQHLVGQALFREGYEVHYAWNGEEGYEKVFSLNPDLVLLDLMLPRMNGVELLQKLQHDKRTKGLPVIIISAYGDEVNMLGYSVKALGAADYLRKPVAPSELVRRIRAVLADFPPAAGAGPAPAPELRKGEVRADPRYRTVWVKDRLVATLPFKRFALLKALIESAGPVSREALLEALGYGPGQANALEKSLQRLREDLGGSEGRRIQTTPQGYELVG